MRKKYLKLTKEQKARNVIFSSQLKGPEYDGHIIEVFAGQEDAEETIARLRNDKFFDDSTTLTYNEIRS